MEWQHSGLPRPEKFGVQKFTGKILASIFYSSLLVQLKDIWKEKCRGTVTEGVLFLHDNAPAHWALATQKKVAYLGFCCLDHPVLWIWLCWTTTCSLD